MDFGLTLYLFQQENIGTTLDKFYRQLAAKLTWYESNIDSTIALYNKEYEQKKSDIEKLYEPSISDAKKVYDFQIKNTDQAKEAHDIASEISGLNELYAHISYDLQELDLYFEDVIDLHNKSSVIAFYTLLESNLNKLCSVLQQTAGTKIKINHLGDKNYFKKARTYLELVIDLDLESLSYQIEKCEEIQFIRNKLIHNAGEFAEPLQQIQKIIDGSNGMAHLAKNYEGNNILIIIESKFIIQYYSIYRQLFQGLLWKINNKFKNQILEARIARLFGYVYQAIEVNIISCNLEDGIHEINGRILSQDQNQMPNCNFIFIISPNEDWAFEAENSLIGHNNKLDNLLSNFSGSRMVFELIFEGFYLEHSNFKFKFSIALI